MRPDGVADFATGETRWEVVETASGLVVRGTATILDRGIEVELTVAPSPFEAGYRLEVSADVPRAYGEQRLTSVATSSRRLLDWTSVPGARWSSASGAVLPATVAQAAFEAEVVTVSVDYRSATEDSDIDVSLALGTTGRAAFARAFGW
ncbi:MAG: hypothetical protein KIS68_13495 [Bauldia sp.]|nr:hypothetical protein [Bauldia sp.]